MRASPVAALSIALFAVPLAVTWLILALRDDPEVTLSGSVGAPDRSRPSPPAARPSTYSA